MDLGLHGRAAIVTGASRGIGRAVAEALVAEGASVLLVARSAAALDEVAADLGPAAVACPADLTDPASADVAATRCWDAFGRLDVLVNNAGDANPVPLDRLTDDDWRRGFELTFFAAERMARACAPVMRTAGWGRMVHVASISGREPDPAFAPYAAAKAALLNLSTSLSRAYAADGVLSSCVVPGITLTELVAQNAAATAERRGTTVEEVMDRMLAKQQVAAGRFGTVEEVAAAVVFLCGEQASWITGATLEVDGGTLRSV
ncbi:MAG TPA: SDR family NAD(P)-dependent oxidoreductase [Iamia sp.]